MSKISYSAVVLDEISRKRLIERFKSIIPNGFEIIAHHMTINLGEIDSKYVRFLGMSINLTVTDVAMNDKVIAVGVSGFDSNNSKPHITLAVNRKLGGKPMMSNSLTNWKEISTPLIISGVVSEVGY